VFSERGKKYGAVPEKAAERLQKDRAVVGNRAQSRAILEQGDATIRVFAPL